jgi:hypothetical protein
MGEQPGRDDPYCVHGREADTVILVLGAPKSVSKRSAKLGGRHAEC